MDYKVYGKNYFTGWRLLKTVNSYEKAVVVVDNIDINLFNEYAIITYNEKLETDEVIETGYVDYPVTRRK